MRTIGLNTMKTLNKNTKGFTLIEYMVGITIGLILIAGIGTFFVGMKQSTVTQNGISEVQENGRFAMYFLSNDIQQSGYLDVEAKNFLITPFEHIAFDGHAKQTADGGDADTSDTIRISFEGDTDCLGAAVAGGVVSNSYFVDNGDLRCTGGSGATETLISNVDSFQVLYGVDRDNNGSSDELIDATDLAANGEADIVVLVKIALLISSDTNVHSAAKSQSFTMLDEGTTTAVSDRKLRRIFTTTILIPNKVNVFTVI